MRVVCISDTHGDHHRLQVPGGDVLVHAGDWSLTGSPADAHAFGAWLGMQPHKHKVIIAGNHDESLHNPIDRDEALSQLWGVHYLEDDSVELDGTTFFGSPWTRRFGDWAFMKPQSEMAAVWAAVPDEADVLITHSPPFGIFDRMADGLPIGCPDMAPMLDRVQPRLHVFGHCHYMGGSVSRPRNGTVFVNAAMLHENYIDMREPVVVEL